MAWGGGGGSVGSCHIEKYMRPIVNSHNTKIFPPHRTCCPSLRLPNPRLRPAPVFLLNFLFMTCFFGRSAARSLARSLARCGVGQGGQSIHTSPSAHVADCGSLLQSAGFSLPTVDQDTVRVGYPNAFVLMEHLQVLYTSVSTVLMGCRQGCFKAPPAVTTIGEDIRAKK